MAKKKLTFDPDALFGILENMKEKASGNIDNEKFWRSEKPEGKKDKNVYIIRFLPRLDSEGKNLAPYVVSYRHYFQSVSTGKRMATLCPSMKGERCPICDYASSLFGTGDPQDEKLAHSFYKKKGHTANIFVRKEASKDREDNVGKVFLYRYGVKIAKKIHSALFPENDDDRIMIFDPNDGYDFNLVVTNVSGHPNYDTSSFARNSSPVDEDPSVSEEIVRSGYDFNEEFKPDAFQSFDELKEIFNVHILGKEAGIESPRKVKKTTKVAEIKTEEIIPEEVETGSTEDEDFLADLENSINEFEDDVPF